MAGLAESVLAGMLADSIKVVALTVISAVLISAGLLWTIHVQIEARPARPHVDADPAPVPEAKRGSVPETPTPKIPDRSAGDASDLAEDPIGPLKLKPRGDERTEARLVINATPGAARRR